MNAYFSRWMMGKSAAKKPIAFTGESSLRTRWDNDSQGSSPVASNTALSEYVTAASDGEADDNRERVVSRDLADYNRSNFRQCWMPDSSGKVCYECREKFTTFRRKHHCRICGQIFCSRCCSQEVSGHLLGYTTDLRVCNFCHNMICNANRLGAGKTGNANSARSTRTVCRSNSEMGTPFSGFAGDSKLTTGAEVLPKRDIIARKERPAHDFAADDGSVCVVEESTADGHYEGFVDDPEPEWLREIQAADLNVDFLNNYSFLATSTPDQTVCAVSANADGLDVEERVRSNHLTTSSAVGMSGSASPLPLVRSPRGHPLAPSPLHPVGTDTMHIFMEKLGRQLEYLLRLEDIPFEPWRNIVMQLAEQVAFTVRPETKTNGDDMSILSYVHVKTIRRSLQPSADLVYGTVCTKAVLRQHMLQRFRSPKILMIQGPIEYERTRGKFCSIDAIIMQERYHLRHVVHKLLALQPDMLIVEDSVASTAQELFSQSGLTVMHNVKRSAMERIARCTRCDVLDSVEGQIFKPRMGRCGLFRTEKASLLDGTTKMLCRFEDCPPQLGCTILLNGPCKWQLHVVKKILKHLIASVYSARLEVEMLDSLQAITSKEGPSSEQGACRICSTVWQSCSDSDCANFPLDLIKYSPFISFVPSKSKLMGETCMPTVRWAEFCSDCTNVEANIPKRPSLPLHRFAVEPLQKSANHLDTRRLLADYRAQGGKLLKRSAKSRCSNQHGALGSLKALDGQMWYTNWRHPFAYGRFTALLSSYLLKSGATSTYCINPHTFSVKFYGCTDLPLGAYLENFCLDPDCQCPREGCDEKMENHIRRFVLGSMSVEADESANQIVLWSWCRHCKASTSERKMSKQLWQLSFATFLDYLFHGVGMSSTLAEETCHHCLFHDRVQVFARQNLLAWFRCQPISLFSTSFASLSLAAEEEKITEEELRCEIGLVEQKADYLFNQMVKAVSTIVAQCDTLGCGQQVTNLIGELQSTLESAQRSFGEEIGALRAMVKSLQSNEGGFLMTQAKLYAAEDSFVVCHRILAAQMFAWNCITCDFVACPLKNRWSDRETDSATKCCPEEVAAGAFDKGHNGSTGEEVPSKKQLSEELKTLQKTVMASQLSSPFDAEQHFSLPIGKVPVAVDERRPGAIIAYALATNEHQDFVVSLEMGSEDILSLLREAVSSSNSPDKELHLAESATVPLVVQFSDATAQFYCKMYFPRLFRALRALLCPFNESTFIRSLANCERWHPTGGKSGAKFFRTRDRRFVFKQMSRFELQSFIHFAPQYFAHVVASANSGNEKRPISLVRIFGAYRIGCKNSQTNATYKTDMIVMEYLFYGRNVRQAYDLKGSRRNRHTSERPKQASSTDLVLLDQNLMEKVVLESFYLNSASKAMLDEAIRRDTLFLSANHIMDYSLLMGVDQENSVLVLGIIDYLRAYTWDKRIESWVKSVSVSGQLPTVVSPELYRLRLLESMDIYFPASPDHSAGVL
uniref:1-phosphatidylinositol-3-phosphate 5-kinase n=1 Tax=Trichuris muris TaxID=70415 RepID=A0A5S6R442_TRIMR